VFLFESLQSFLFLFTFCNLSSVFLPRSPISCLSNRLKPKQQQQMNECFCNGDDALPMCDSCWRNGFCVPHNHEDSDMTDKIRAAPSAVQAQVQAQLRPSPRKRSEPTHKWSQPCPFFCWTKRHHDLRSRHPHLATLFIWNHTLHSVETPLRVFIDHPETDKLATVATALLYNSCCSACFAFRESV
jgi:hypothetical protein